MQGPDESLRASFPEPSCAHPPISGARHTHGGLQQEGEPFRDYDRRLGLGSPNPIPQPPNALHQARGTLTGDYREKLLLLAAALGRAPSSLGASAGLNSEPCRPLNWFGPC